MALERLLSWGFSLQNHRSAEFTTPWKSQVISRHGKQLTVPRMAAEVLSPKTDIHSGGTQFFQEFYVEYGVAEVSFPKLDA